MPNIDVFPTDVLGKGDNPIVKWISTGSYYKLESHECRNFLRTLEPHILRHPLSRHNQFNHENFEHAINELLHFSQPKRQEESKVDEVQRVLFSVMLQEVRSVFAYAREHSIPAASNLLSNWPAVNAPEELTSDDVLIALYFDNAIYSPRPKMYQKH